MICQYNREKCRFCKKTDMIEPYDDCTKPKGKKCEFDVKKPMLEFSLVLRDNYWGIHMEINGQEAFFAHRSKKASLSALKRLIKKIQMNEFEIIK